MKRSSLRLIALALLVLGAIFAVPACGNGDDDSGSSADASTSPDASSGADPSTGTDAAAAADVSSGADSAKAGDAAQDGPAWACNYESPAQLRHYDATNDCFEAAVATPGVCDGTPGIGDGPGGLACAFTPDGQIYVDFVCENCVLSGAGYVYAQFEFGGDRPESLPGQMASSSQIDMCDALTSACKRDCSTGRPVGNQCPLDAGADAASH